MDNEKKVHAIAKAIAYAENNGKPRNIKAGKTGEMKSVFQFTPGTWKLYSKQVFGKDGVPLNNDTETYVVTQKVKKWLDSGYNTQQIASMWNAGEAKPNAYKEGWKGVNAKYGVGYDTPAYAQKVSSYAGQFENQNQYQPIKNNQPDQDTSGVVKNYIEKLVGNVPNKIPKNPTNNNVGLMQQINPIQPLI